MVRVVHIIMIAIMSSVNLGVAHADQIQVSQKEKQFDPDEITAKAGDTITITNDDDVVHNVLINGPQGEAPINTGLQKVGEHTDVRIEKLGDYMIRCGIHPKMKLIVHAQ